MKFLILSVLFTGGFACDIEAIDNCLKGVLYGADDNRTYFWTDVEELDSFCDRLSKVPACIRQHTGGCSPSAVKYLHSLQGSYGDLNLCAKNALGHANRVAFANRTKCMKEKFDNGCMVKYIKKLDRIVTNNTAGNVISQACCVHRRYQYCQWDTVKALCGEEDAQSYTEFTNQIASRSIKDICDNRDNKCDVNGWEHQVVNGTIVRRHLAMLIAKDKETPPQTGTTRRPHTTYSCEPTDVDECVKGLVFGGQSDTTFFWSTTTELENYCKGLVGVDQCLDSSTDGCGDNVRDYIKDLKMEYTGTKKEQLCTKLLLNETRQESIKCGTCLKEKFDKTCTVSFIGKLEHLINGNYTDKLSIACCLHHEHNDCVTESLTKGCGSETAKSYALHASDMVIPSFSNMCPKENVSSCKDLEWPAESSEAYGTPVGRISQLLKDSDRENDP